MELEELYEKQDAVIERLLELSAIGEEHTLIYEAGVMELHNIEAKIKVAEYKPLPHNNSGITEFSINNLNFYGTEKH